MTLPDQEFNSPLAVPLWSGAKSQSSSVVLTDQHAPMTLDARPDRAGLDPEGHAAALGAANKAARDDPPSRDPNEPRLAMIVPVSTQKCTRLPWAQPTRQLAMVLQVSIRKKPRLAMTPVGLKARIGALQDNAKPKASAGRRLQAMFEQLRTGCSGLGTQTRP
jgi:hypothetical protein